MVFVSGPEQTFNRINQSVMMLAWSAGIVCFVQKHIEVECASCSGVWARQIRPPWQKLLIGACPHLAQGFSLLVLDLPKAFPSP